MFSHIFMGVSNFDRALAFYSPVMAALGLELRFSDIEVPWAAWHSAGGNRPFFVIRKPFNGSMHEEGNGQMVAFLSETREAVRSVYSVAIEAGGSCEGKPGLRPEYHPHYYGAYFRDCEGNKLAVACHSAYPA